MTQPGASGPAARPAPHEEALPLSRPSVFGSPLFLGFDHLEQMLDRVAKNADGYPPYNIEQTAENRLRITLAVAGFAMDDLQITQEDNQLVIRGRQRDDSEGRIFLHRGIAARQFQRAFVLAEGIEVEGAWLDNGLLHVDLQRPQPEVRVRTIQINGGGARAGASSMGTSQGSAPNAPPSRGVETRTVNGASLPVVEGRASRG
jgi:HSP20 family molecular chaperone IbpA